MPMGPTSSSRRKARPTAPVSGRGLTAATRATAGCGVSGGRRAPSRPDAFGRVCLVAFVCSALLTGCAGGGDESAPSLLDGTSAREAPVELEGVHSPPVMTSAAVVPIDTIDPDSVPASCLRGQFDHLAAVGSAVVR